MTPIRIVDNLPAAIPKTYQDANGETNTIYETGFPLGFKGEDQNNDVYNIYNHVHIILLYHKNAQSYEGRRIVGFEIETDRYRCKMHQPLLNSTFPAFVTQTLQAIQQTPRRCLKLASIAKMYNCNDWKFRRDKILFPSLGRIQLLGGYSDFEIFH
jgi:hypothetical protein